MKKRLPLDLLLLFVDILMVKLNIAHAFHYYTDNSSQMSAGDVTLPNEASASTLKNNVLVNDAIKKVVRLLSSIKEEEQDPYVPKNGQPEDPFSTKYEHKPLVELGEIENLNKKYFTDFQLGQDPEKMMHTNSEDEYFPDRPVQREENFYQIDQLYKLNTPRVLRKAGHDDDDDDDHTRHQKPILKEVRTTKKPEELKDTAEEDRKRLDDHSKDVDNVDDHNDPNEHNDHSKDEEYHDDDPYSIKKASMIDDPYLMNKDISANDPSDPYSIGKSAIDHNDPYSMGKDIVHHTTHHPHDDHTPQIHELYNDNYKNYFNDMPFKDLIKSSNPAIDPAKYPPRKLTVDFGYSFVDDKNSKKNKENNNEHTSPPKGDHHHIDHPEKPHNKHYTKISEVEDDVGSGDDKEDQPEKEKKMKKVADLPKTEDDSEPEDYDAYSAPKDKQSQTDRNNDAIKKAVELLSAIQEKKDRYKLVAQRNSEPKRDVSDDQSDRSDSTTKRKRKPKKKMARKSGHSDDESDTDSEVNLKRNQRSKKRSRKPKDKDSDDHNAETTTPAPYAYHSESPNNKMKRKSFHKMFYIDSEPQNDTPARKKQTKKEKNEKGDKEDKEAQLSQSDDEYEFHGDEVDKEKKKNRKEPTGKMYLSIDYQYDDGKNKKDGLQEDEPSGERNRDNGKTKRRPPVNDRTHSRAKFVSTGRISQSK